MKNEPLYTDSQIIHIFKERDELGIEKVYKYLYKLVYPIIDSFVKNNGGINEDDTYDLFTTSFLVLYENVKKGHFKGDSTLSTYFISICRMLWLKKLRERSKNREIELDEVMQEVLMDTTNNVEQSLLYQEEESSKRKIVRKIFNEMSISCKEIIYYHYFSNMPQEEIAHKLGFKNAQTVKSAKSRCLKKMIEIYQMIQQKTKAGDVKNED